MKNLVIISFILLLTISCKQDNSIVKTSAIGKYNSLLIVVDDDKWQGQVGDSLRAVFAKDLVGYNQTEPTFTINQIADRNFASILRPSRSILKIKYGKENKITTNKDVYAAPQNIVTIKVKDDKSLFMLLKDKENELVKTFKNFDLDVYKSKLTEKLWNPENVATFRNLKVKMKIPYAYRKVHDTLNYIWFKKDIPQGWLNIQMYAVPITSEDNLSGNTIIENRDKYGKKYVVGSKEGSYMITEKAFTPFRFETKIDGKFAYETRGTWEMVDVALAGPFLNYTILDKKNNRQIVVEGFTYAPNVYKRDFMFELEAILKTVEIE